MLVLQGAEDAVVPPAQAELMVEALERKRLPYAYLLFEGEQHGFRKADSIIRAHEGELSFYAQILGFETGRSDPAVGDREPPGLRPGTSSLSRRSWTSTVPAARSPAWLIRWPDHFAQTPSRISPASSSSEAPSRSGERRSVSSIANRQLRNAPSAVSRSRLHVSQKGSVTLAITPIAPGAPSANR